MKIKVTKLMSILLLTFISNLALAEEVATLRDDVKIEKQKKTLEYGIISWERMLLKNSLKAT